MWASCRSPSASWAASGRMGRAPLRPCGYSRKPRSVALGILPPHVRCSWHAIQVMHGAERTRHHSWVPCICHQTLSCELPDVRRSEPLMHSLSCAVHGGLFIVKHLFDKIGSPSHEKHICVRGQVWSPYSGLPHRRRFRMLAALQWYSSVCHPSLLQQPLVSAPYPRLVSELDHTAAARCGRAEACVPP